MLSNIAAVWYIWVERNHRIFKKSATPRNLIYEDIIKDVPSYLIFKDIIKDVYLVSYFYLEENISN